MPTDPYCAKCRGHGADRHGPGCSHGDPLDEAYLANSVNDYGEAWILLADACRIRDEAVAAERAKLGRLVSEVRAAIAWIEDPDEPEPTVAAAALRWALVGLVGEDPDAD